MTTSRLPVGGPNQPSTGRQMWFTGLCFDQEVRRNNGGAGEPAGNRSEG